ncbi:hypothetical protein RJ641_013391 [Dillenia turbinata]|uniref:Uncharacterized protein n=1 Tax=Dillenia turbinata TaxID=194707 RepID=A0AAN8WCL7_9MAGN
MNYRKIREYVKPFGISTPRVIFEGVENLDERTKDQQLSDAPFPAPQNHRPVLGPQLPIPSLSQKDPKPTLLGLSEDLLNTLLPPFMKIEQCRSQGLSNFVPNIPTQREFPFLMAPTHELHQISVPQSTDDPYFRSVLFFPLFGTPGYPLNSNIVAQGRTGIYLQIGTEIPTSEGMYLIVYSCGSRNSKSNPFRQVVRQVNRIREVLQKLEIQASICLPSKILLIQLTLATDNIELRSIPTCSPGGSHPQYQLDQVSNSTATKCSDDKLNGWSARFRVNSPKPWPPPARGSGKSLGARKNARPSA